MHVPYDECTRGAGNSPQFYSEEKSVPNVNGLNNNFGNLGMGYPMGGLGYPMGGIGEVQAVVPPRASALGALRSRAE